MESCNTVFHILPHFSHGCNPALSKLLWHQLRQSPLVHATHRLLDRASTILLTRMRRVGCAAKPGGWSEEQCPTCAWASAWRKGRAFQRDSTGMSLSISQDEQKQRNLLQKAASSVHPSVMTKHQNRGFNHGHAVLWEQVWDYRGIFPPVVLLLWAYNVPAWGDDILHLVQSIWHCSAQHPCL